MSAKNYVFTKFGDLYFTYDFRFPEDVRYCVGQIETCPETQRLHFQGYIQFFKKCRGINKIKELFKDNTIHVEIARGTAKECIGYCTKDDTRTAGPFEFGVPQEQGSRTDITEFKEAIKRGDSKRELCDKYFAQYLKYSKMINECRKLLSPVENIVKYKLEDFDFPPLDFDKSNVIIGPSGIGKTYFALAHFKNPLFVTHIDQLGDLEKEHDGIVFDDMDFKHIPPVHQIHLLEQETPVHYHIRYTTAFIPARTKKIFCCNEDPFSVVLNEHKRAIEKRAKYIFIDFDIRKINN